MNFKSRIYPLQTVRLHVIEAGPTDGALQKKTWYGTEMHGGEKEAYMP
jgi:hypothetical protein